MRKYVYCCLLAVILWTLAACGDEAGIEDPLLPPDEAGTEEALGDTISSLPALYGNYFLLATDCPNDASALQISQAGAALQVVGGFDFPDAPKTLLGFTDEAATIRFFADSAEEGANCVALVDGESLRGSCSYLEAAEARTCRFAYGKEIAGDYALVWNQCAQDGSALKVVRDKNEFTLKGGFDYIVPVIDQYHGVIQSGELLFNIGALQAESFVVPVDIPDFNCRAVVSGGTFRGRCTDLTVTPPTQCSFGYSNQARAEQIDLNDAGLFPEPTISFDLGPTASADFSGSYALISNTCENDSSNITIAQEGVNVGMVGGFDYQAASPDHYAGTINGDFRLDFSLLGTSAQMFCSAFLGVNAQQQVLLGGFCASNDEVSDDSCQFSYLKVP